VNVRPNRYHGRVQHADGRRCAEPGCAAAGEFRAPKGPSPEIDGYLWLCLDHVRAFNENWNFFNGLSPEVAARLNHRYATWDRPTWPRGGLHGHRWIDPQLIDGQEIFSGQPGLARFAERLGRGRGGRPLSAADRAALAALGLDETATAQDIKWQYKILLKRYHPDTNGGDRSGERRLQKVIRAYQHLAGMAVR